MADGFGVRFKQLRKEKKMTQSDVALRLGVEKSTISNWESAARVPNIKMFEKIAKLFNVSSDYVYGISDQKYNVLIPKETEIDITKLNSRGIEQMRLYYRFLLQCEDFTKE